MAALSTIAIVSAVATGIGTVMQISAQQDAKKAGRRQADEMRKQAEMEQRKSDIQNARQLRNAVRQSRMATATILNTGANAGASGSSGVLGGAASVGSQNNANIGFAGQMGQLNSSITSSQVAQGGAAADAGAAQGAAATWGAFGKLGGTVFDQAGGFKTIFAK